MAEAEIGSFTMSGQKLQRIEVLSEVLARQGRVHLLCVCERTVQ